MKKLLNKPFKIPVPGYELSRRFLGVHFLGPRGPLHDPNEANALIVYSPPEISEHEKLKLDPYVDNISIQNIFIQYLL